LRLLRATLPVPAILLACAAPAAAQKAPDRIESPVLFFPADVTAAERQAKEGEALVTIPLRWAFSGKLERDIEVVAGEHRAMLNAGELLPKVLIPAPGKTNEGRFLFCTRNKVTEERKGSAPIAALVDSLRDSLRDAQFCVEDSDADGKVDRGVVFGKGKTELVGESFAPAAVTEFTNEVIPGGKDRVEIKLDAVGKKRSRLLVNVWQNGGPRVFSSMRSGRFFADAFTTIEHKTSLPAAKLVFGIRVSVLGVEPAANTATLGWQAMARPGEFVIIPRVTNVSFSY
jgi:hypothetical protein